MSRTIACLVATLALTTTARAGAPASRTVTEDQLPRGLKVPPHPARALAWTDGNGDGYLIFSELSADHEDEGRSVWLQVDLVAVPRGGKPRILRTVKDQVLDCTEDLTGEFVPDATAITDLDGDGVAEATFAYRIACKGDVAPDTVKVLVLENKDKYILRGDDFFAMDPGKGKHSGGTYKPEPAAAKWPPAFLDQAKKTWAAIVKK
jgi:hypothetical protein